MPDADRTAPPVLVAGDANPDLILRGDVVPRFGQAEQLLTGADLVIGGSAAITAHGLARLGRPVSLVAAIGADAAGERMLGDLASAGVRLEQLVRRTGVPTGLTVVLSTGDDRAILTLPGAVPTLTVGEIRSAVAATGARHLHLSSLFLQPGLAPDLPELLAEVRAAGLSTSLDTNDDPAGTWLGVTALLPHLDLLLPNRAEVLALARGLEPGRNSRPEAVDDAPAAAARLAAHGPTVVVKDGARGAFAVLAGSEPVMIGTRPREVVDTTGAGDTFNAAFLDSWLSGRPLTDCLHRAATAGSLAVTATGGTAAQPTAAELTHAADRSSVRP